MTDDFPIPQRGNQPEDFSTGVPDGCERSDSTLTGANAPDAPDTLDASYTRETPQQENPLMDIRPGTPGAEVVAPGSAQAQRGQGRNSHTREEWEAAQALANICEEFMRLMATGNHSLRTAAAEVEKSPSWFSGSNSMLMRYQREGVAGLLPKRAEAKVQDLTKTLEALGWFIPAARFFYLISNRTSAGGSVPEAIRRAISLPHLPVGWKKNDTARFLKAIDMPEAPVFPEALRNQILVREKESKEFVPERIARQITARAATVHQHRNPKNAALDYLNSPGGMRLFEGRLARAGEIIEADDATINFPVCVPWERDGSDDPCVKKFGVKVARFQWLVSIDVGTSFITGYSYTARPRSSYRAEDIISLIRMLVRKSGVPKLWRFERGAWESKLVKDAIRNMGSGLHTVYSPHQKPFIEGLFNTLWTKLSVQFPGAHVGRFQGEHADANALLTACQQGHKDPRRYFPMLSTAIAAFDEVIAEKNRTPVSSANHGLWVPEQRWAEELNPRFLDGGSDWMFAPWRREWQVKGMLVGGRVPIFEDFSVPFEFSAPWLPQFHGARVICYCDPADPRCVAGIVLAEPFNGRKAGDFLGTAGQISSAAGYVRLVMGWGEDPEHAGRLARQKAAAAMRREVRAVVPKGQTAAAVSEERDGVGQVIRLEQGTAPAAEPAPESAAPEAIEERARKADEFLESNPLDFV